MEARTEENSKVHVDELSVEAREDEVCAGEALADVEEQMIPATKVEVCETTLREASPIPHHLLTGEGFNSGANVQNARKGKKIFVGGLPSDLTTEEFTSFFERFGEITDAVIIPDSLTGRSRGFGFVTFDSKESVDSVLQCRRYVIKDKNVEVKSAIPKEEMNASAQQSNENRPRHTWFPYEIRPDVYGHDHHFNAFTFVPGMWGLFAAPQLYANNRTEAIRSGGHDGYWVNRDIEDSQALSRGSELRDSQLRISKTVKHFNHVRAQMTLPDRGSSSVDHPSGGC